MKLAEMNVYYTKSMNSTQPAGPIHLVSKDYDETLCGLKINERWYITGEPATCKKCMKEMENDNKSD